MTSDASPALRSREVSLVDLLDRVLSAGVVIAGDITIAIADVDLVRISLRALVASASTVLGVADEERPPAIAATRRPAIGGGAEQATIAADRQWAEDERR